MLKRSLFCGAGALAFGVAHVLTPAPTRAADPLAGCNQECTGDFPWECTHTNEHIFCVGANPPWRPCQQEPHECT
jgi:hypothetical protein